MRWIPTLIAIYLVALVQVSFGQVWVVQTAWGRCGPDLLLIVALFAALYARTRTEALIGAWIVGTAIDLTTGTGTGGVTVIGPMALALCLCCWCIFAVRDAVYRNHLLPRIVLGVLLCFVAHSLWAVLQCAAANQWNALQELWIPIGMVSLYTGLVTPLLMLPLVAASPLLLTTPPSKHRQRR